MMSFRKGEKVENREQETDEEEREDAMKGVHQSLVSILIVGSNDRVALRNVTRCYVQQTSAS